MASPATPVSDIVVAMTEKIIGGSLHSERG